jgi:saccharopine dehydrogenase-like NADP-dependent oxidoreductase
LLVNQWKLEDGEDEFTVMRIIIKGEGRIIEYNMVDRYDPKTNTSSMARTTGYTCTAAVNLIANGLYKEKGVSPPEYVGRNKDCFDYIMKYLAKREVNWEVKTL